MASHRDPNRHPSSPLSKQRPAHHSNHHSKHRTNQVAKKIALTLKSAEEKHLLDCPNSDFIQRASAFVLDAILFFLSATGLRHICQTLNTHLSHLPLPELHGKLTVFEALLVFLVKNSDELTAHLLITFKITLFFFYFVWTLSYSGGSPAKLLFGLYVVDDQTGERLPLSRALFRELVAKPISALLIFYGFMLIYLKKDHRALHDKLSHSLVKKVHGAR